MDAACPGDAAQVHCRVDVVDAMLMRLSEGEKSLREIRAVLAVERNKDVRINRLSYT